MHVLGAGGTGTAGTLGTGLGAGLGGGAAPVAAGCVGGSHPPFTHTQSVPGDAVRHADVGGTCGAGAGPGAGGGGWAPPAGGNHAPFIHVHPAPGEAPTQLAGPGAGGVTAAPVTNVYSSDVVVSAGFTSVACVRGTMRQ